VAVSKDDAVRLALFEELAALDATVNEPNSGSFRIESMLTNGELLVVAAGELV